MLWHPTGSFAVPDLASGAASGSWRRVQLDGAEVAFRSRRSGVIAVRARCEAERESSEVESRHLWLGIERGPAERRPITVAGAPAVETIATSEGVRVRTIVIETGSCTLDLAHAISETASPSGAFDEFVRGVRLAEDR